MTSVIVIGSGFGGSIAAKRFAEAGQPVTILEMGEDWGNGREIPQTQDPHILFKLLRDYPTDYLVTKPHLMVTLGMGLGGGSLVYSAIHLRAPAHSLESWPGGFTRARLDPYYARVEQRLGVKQFEPMTEYGRSRAFAAGAKAAGLPPAQLNPLALSNCTMCGWCVPICSQNRKVTMAHTYLVDAKQSGKLTVKTRRKAAWIEAKKGGGYRVATWSTESADKEYHRVNSGELEYHEADQVVVACGAIESPALLERSRERLRAFPSSRLGQGIDGTGDLIQGGFVPQVVDGYKGSVMMMNVDMGDYVLEDAHAFPVGPAVTLGVRLPGQNKTWGLAYKEGFRGYGRHMLGIAIVGKAGGNTVGNMSVRDDKGNARVSTTAYLPPVGSVEAARAMITAQGGEVADTPWELSKTAFTVHPVGGCAMGDAADAVVTTDRLEVRENPGLHVIDGSVLPGTPMRNPSHTIAAVAERAMDVILGQRKAEEWS